MEYHNYRNKIINPDWEEFTYELEPYKWHKATQMIRPPTRKKKPDQELGDYTYNADKEPIAVPSLITAPYPKLIDYTSIADVEPIAVPSLITVPDFIANSLNNLLIPDPLRIANVIGNFISPTIPEEEYIYDELPARATVEMYPEMPIETKSTASGSAQPKSPQPKSPGTGEIFPIPGYKPQEERIERFHFDQSAIEERLKKVGTFFDGLTGFLS